MSKICNRSTTNLSYSCLPSAKQHPITKKNACYNYTASRSHFKIKKNNNYETVGKKAAALSTADTSLNTSYAKQR